MRNLKQYPITTEEVIERLDRLKSECDEDLFGDMTPLLLDEAMRIILDHEQCIVGSGG